MRGLLRSKAAVVVVVAPGEKTNFLQKVASLIKNGWGRNDRKSRKAAEGEIQQRKVIQKGNLREGEVRMRKTKVYLMWIVHHLDSLCLKDL